MTKIIFFTLTLFSFFNGLNALYRDYHFDCDNEASFELYYQSYCLDHAPDNTIDDLETYLLKLIPSTGHKCKSCNKKSIYL